MLVLSRKVNESIVINDDISITIVDIRGDKVRLGVEAPKETPVHRREVYDAIRHSEQSRLQPLVEAEAPVVNQQSIDCQERIKKLEADNQSLLSRNAHLEEKLDEFQEKINKLHTDYQITISNLHNEVDDLQDTASKNERVITTLQDEITDLADCKEHLRRLGQEFSGCDHVESADERAQQVKHVMDTIRKLADANIEYQQEITGLQNQLRAAVPIAEPTITLCGKHSIIHTKNRGCYLCNIENDNLRAAFPRATKLS